MWGKNKEFYRAGYLTEEPNLYRRTKGRHEGKKFHDYKHGFIESNAIGLYTAEYYTGPRRESMFGRDGARCGAGTEEGRESGEGEGKKGNEKDRKEKEGKERKAREKEE